MVAKLREGLGRESKDMPLKSTISSLSSASSMPPDDPFFFLLVSIVIGCWWWNRCCCSYIIFPNFLNFLFLWYVKRERMIWYDMIWCNLRKRECGYMEKGRTDKKEEKSGVAGSVTYDRNKYNNRMFRTCLATFPTLIKSTPLFFSFFSIHILVHN